jgi:hypothetical protein
MNTFSVLQEHETARCRYDIDDILNDKEQRKFKKKLKKEREKSEPDTKYIACLEQAINAYKNPPEAPTKALKKVNQKQSSKEDEKFLQEAFREASKHDFTCQEQVTEEKAQRRLQQQKNIARKEINRRIRIHKKMFIKEYFNVFTTYCKKLISKSTMKVKQFRFIQSEKFLSVIIYQWKQTASRLIIHRGHQERFLNKCLMELRIKQCFDGWKEETLNKMECPLCISRVPKADCYTADCGHAFCNDCIGKWKTRCIAAGNDITCPICRAVFDYRSIADYEPLPQRQEQLIPDDEPGSTDLDRVLLRARELLESLRHDGIIYGTTLSPVILEQVRQDHTQREKGFLMASFNGFRDAYTTATVSSIIDRSVVEDSQSLLLNTNIFLMHIERCTLWRYITHA